ncbi:MAG: tetratricopeptide repeat protein [Chloroflexota bacterium]
MSTKKESPKDKFAPNFRRGTELLRRGEASRAMVLLERAHKIDPAHVDAAINLSGAYILQKKFKQAVAILEPLKEQDEENAMVWVNLGAAYLGNPILAKDDNQLNAIDAFKKALDINPVAPNVAYNIGLIYRDRKETDLAIEWFNKAIKANPLDKDARNLIEKLTSSKTENE